MPILGEPGGCPCFFEGTAPNGQSVKLLYTIQFENINIISTHITSPSWYEVDVAVRVVAPLDCSSSVSSDGGKGGCPCCTA